MWYPHHFHPKVVIVIIIVQLAVVGAFGIMVPLIAAEKAKEWFVFRLMLHHMIHPQGQQKPI